MDDLRVSRVEDNLLDFYHTGVTSGLVETDGHPDVDTFHLPGRAHPLFNAIAGARFAEGTLAERTEAVLAPYVRRGMPFLWWTTPSTHAADLAPLLTAAGMLTEHVPGMHRDLTEPVDPAVPDGIEMIRVSTPEDTDELVRTAVVGFEIPEPYAPDMALLFQSLRGPRLIAVVARQDGEAVACGTAWIAGDTAGLYNIATLEASRGRGIGRAVTATLMNLARDRGCTHTILHASEMGRPVYEGLGYVDVCDVPQFIWLPGQD